MAVSLNAGQKVYALPRSIVGLSGHAKTAIKIPDSTSKALLRKLRSGPFYLHEISAPAGTESSTSSKVSAAANVLISPRSLGDIATVELPSGTAGLVCKANSFLACTGDVDIKSSFDGVKIVGEGSVAVAAYGVIHRLSLQTGEEYHVDPRHLVAYSSKYRPAAVVSAIPETAVEDVEKQSFSKLIQRYMLQSIRKITLDPLRRARYWFLGDSNAFVKLSGPGEFLVSTRTPPRMGALTSALAELQYQGKLLKEGRAFRDGKLEGQMMIGSEAERSGLNSFQVTVANGKVLFENAPTNPLIATKSTLSPQLPSEPATIEEKPREPVNETVVVPVPPAKPSEIKVAKKTSSSWKTLLFGSSAK